MAYKTLLSVLTDAADARPALAAAVEAARRMDAHLNVLCMALGADQMQAAAFYPGPGTLMLDPGIEEVQAEAKAIAGAAEDVLKQQDIRWSVESCVAQLGGLGDLVSERARFCDLMVAVRSARHPHDSAGVIEAALFAGQTPVLMIPASGLPAAFGTIVLGWDQSRGAMHAARAALPLMQGARSVSIAIIDPAPDGPERSDPGGALCRMLARHGVRAEVSVLPRTLPTIADELMRHMRDRGADLLVMGAYGHSRLREQVLGGVTRTMIAASEFAVFMAH